MNDKSNFYCKKLSELKENLPYGYQRTIYKNLIDVELWKIKGAFAGTFKDEETLSRIFTEATFLAKKNINKKKRAAKAAMTIKAMAKHVAAFFLFMLGNKMH